MSSMKTNLAIERICTMLDQGSFIEIGHSISARNTDFKLMEKETPADGVITGYGVIDNNLVYVYSQDSSVLGGSVGEMHANKIAKIYEMAMKMGAPVIALIDSTGLRLEEATDALHAFGNIYMKQTLASGVIPQITAIFGSCGGGLAVLPGLSDFTFIEKEANLFVNSPNAIIGNTIGKNNTSTSCYQSEETGLIDGVGTEEEILMKIRELVAVLPANNEDNDAYDECTDDLNRVCDHLEESKDDPTIIFSIISDNGIFIETKKDFARDMVTGFIRLNGMTIGVVANRKQIYGKEGEVEETFDGCLSPRAARKAAEFVEFCDGFNIPLLSLTNVEGYRATACSEKNIAREVAKLTYAFANATVPKVNIVTGKAYGTAYIAMNSKSIGADMVFAWPNSSIAMMDEQMAAKIMFADSDAEVIMQKAEEYKELQSNILSAARRGYVDTIIIPEHTRKYVIGAFEMLFTKREDRPVKKHGTI